MVYKVKEIFYTLQGEGRHAGRPAVFCRFSGCNLWTGHERDRHRAICTFCDTDFVGTDGPGGGRFRTAVDLASAVACAWQGKAHRRSQPYVVCTGGEPLLQLDAEAIEELHREGFEVAIETNGTRRAPPGIDWICVSPKAGTDLVLTTGDELKLVFPQPNVDPEQFESLDFTRFTLQPMDGPDRLTNTKAAVEYCLTHPQWQLSVQTHKYIGIP
jgi:7-carboxy-7-deazaguanine synthase (Cx14CxxC type)